MKKAILYFILASGLSYSNFQPVEASHWAGGSITYRYLGPNQYLVKCILYRDCSGASGPMGNLIALDYASPSCGINQQVNLPLLAGYPKLVSFGLCTPSESCSGTALTGVNEYVFQMSLTLPQACNDWVFTFAACCRAFSQNLNGSSSHSLLIRTTMNNLDFPGNSSSENITHGYRAYCTNKSYLFEQHVSDIDGDQLRFRLTSSLTFSGSPGNPVPIAYNAPYSPACFMATSPACGMVPDSLTGQITFTPSITGTWLMSVLVEEYEPFAGGRLIGTVLRDIFIRVFPICSVTVPGYSTSVKAQGIEGSCGDHTFLVTLNSPVRCSSVEPGGSDFWLLDGLSLPVPLKSVTPVNCLNGFASQLLVSTVFPMETGFYYLVSKVGIDNNTLLSECSVFMPEFDTALVKVAPGQPPWPEKINGSNIVCAGSANQVYSVEPLICATTYNWTVPQNAVITLGQGTESITVSFGSFSGDVAVSTGNAAGFNIPVPKAVTVINIPARPGLITGPSTVISGQTAVNYSVMPVKGSTLYVWTLPKGAVILSGAGTNSISVLFGNSSGNVSVAGGNICGLGPAQTLKVNVWPAISVQEKVSQPTETGFHEMAVKLYPNPARDKVTVEFSMEKPGSFEIQMLDVLGREKGTWKGQSVTPEISESITLEDLRSGIYFIRIRTGESSAVVRMVKE